MRNSDHTEHFCVLLEIIFFNLTTFKEIEGCQQKQLSPPSQYPLNIEGIKLNFSQVLLQGSSCSLAGLACYFKRDHPYSTCSLLKNETKGRQDASQKQQSLLSLQLLNRY